MQKYKVLVEFEIDGAVKLVGSILEFSEEAAADFVSDGRVALAAEGDKDESEAPAPEATPTPTPTAAPANDGGVASPDGGASGAGSDAPTDAKDSA